MKVNIMNVFVRNSFTPVKILDAKFMSSVQHISGFTL